MISQDYNLMEFLHSSLRIVLPIFTYTWKLCSLLPCLKEDSQKDGKFLESRRSIKEEVNLIFITTAQLLRSATTKLFEKIIFKKLSFLIRGYIEPNQHGFMPCRSRTINLAVFTNHCVNAFENHLQMDTTYTDFAKAFDKVCHSALKAKLSKLGFHSSSLNWITVAIMLK